MKNAVLATLIIADVLAFILLYHYHSMMKAEFERIGPPFFPNGTYKIGWGSAHDCIWSKYELKIIGLSAIVIGLTWAIILMGHLVRRLEE